MGSRDPLITYLKDFGYSVVRLPRTNVRPLQLITKRGNSYERLGEMATLFVPGETPLPTICADNPTAPINGKKSSNLNIGVGLSLLGNILSAMGGGTVGLDVAYKDARFAVFEFDGVFEDSVDIAQVDQFLSDARVDHRSTSLGKLLEADQIYVTTVTIKSKKFTIEAKKTKDVGVNVSVPVVQGVVGGTVKVGADSEFESKITYEGSVPLVFGFQSVRLFYEDGIFTSVDPDKAGQAGLERIGVEDPLKGREPLRTESPFLPLLNVE